ncbi:MAG TPA: pyridoxamine 5'-phosphate oxidase family protein [Ilumatobacter sp.]|nr:pyridoxamine 5'-phosphate oxidase family protein [Ilumatobacter sp.]
MAVPQHAEVLNVETCWELLEAGRVGRIAVDIAGQPDIFPINYVVDTVPGFGKSIVFRTAAGTKLAGAVLGPWVAFEIDGVTPDARTVWSVVVKGTAREVENMYERFAVESLPLYPWIADPKPNFVRVEPTLVTGRRFHVVDEADLDRPAPDLDHHPGAPQLPAD